MKKFGEYVTVCAIGSAGYSLLEILWRGFTHWTMLIAGGIGFLIIYFMEKRIGRMSLIKKCAMGCLVLTTVEFIAGCIVNRIFGLTVWDYSTQPGNLMGQICPMYSILWFLLCIPIFPISHSLQALFSRNEMGSDMNQNASTALNNIKNEV